MHKTRSSLRNGRAGIRKELRVFAWNLRSLDSPFERHSVALNTIERGRAWHWRLLPAGWADPAFIFRHGQLKTKRAFRTFLPHLRDAVCPSPKQTMTIRRPPTGGSPLPWEAVKTVFAEHPKLMTAGVLAGAQALLNEHLSNEFGRFSFDIDLHTAREPGQIHALFTRQERKRIRLISKANPEMYVYEVGTSLGPVKIEIAKPYLRPVRPPIPSKHIPGLRVTQLADLIDAKISALSTRGFARDFVDLYSAHKQKRLQWRRLLIRASRNQLNDYNPVEFENNLKLLEHEFQQRTQDLPCSRPPAVGVLIEFLEELRAVNAKVARELTSIDSGIGDEDAE